MAKEKKRKTREENVKNPKVLNEARDVVATRGRTFEGFVTKKFPRRVVVEFERTVFVKKYSAFYKKKTRLHARLPDLMSDSINVGDYIKVRECRPLSKIIHFVVIEKIRSADVKDVKEIKSGDKKQ